MKNSLFGLNNKDGLIKLPRKHVSLKWIGFDLSSPTVYLSSQYSLISPFLVEHPRN